MYRILFIILITSIGIHPSYSQADWKLATEEEGIKVYIKSAPGSNIKFLKLECMMDATAEQLVALLLDIPATPTWMPQTKVCRYLRKVSATDIFYYTEVGLPWPLYNRDYVTHLQLNQHPVTKVVTIEVPTIAGELAPKEGIVRINNAKGTWVISPHTTGSIKLVYSLFVDPGGILPAVLINYFTTQATVEIIKNMRELVQRPPYRNARLPFIAK